MNQHSGDLPQIDDDRLSRLIDAAHLALDAAAPITTAGFRQPLIVENKLAGMAVAENSTATRFDPVTAADRDAEHAIRDCLQKQAPGVGFMGEETGTQLGESGLMWVVDPIDGTRAYISGMPLWGTLIALFDGQEVVFGMLDQPVMGERFVGQATGTSVRSHDAVLQLRTRDTAQISDAILYCTTTEMFIEASQRAAFDRVSAQVAMTRFGGDCYAYAMLAAGHIDIVIECDLKPYDIQALIPVVRGAGGMLTNWHGGSAAAGGCVVACSSSVLHGQVLALLGQ
ncbi:MAG: histidinol-phosphatase [Granulosicoccus sp.]